MTSTPVKTNHVSRPSPGTAEICQPRPLRQPRFYANQILQDADLNDLVAWTRDKLQLHRYREGWGVVCGLRVGVDDMSGNRIVVAPGYAIDSCGRDIIVCSDECHRAEIAVRDLFDGLARDCAPSGGQFGFACYDNDLKNIRVVDITLGYAEKGGDHQPVGKGGSVRCETGRTREAYSLKWHEGAVGDDPLAKYPGEWRDSVRETFNKLFRNRVQPYVNPAPGAPQQPLEVFKAALVEACHAAGSHEFPLAHLAMVGNEDKATDTNDSSKATGFESLMPCAFLVALDCLCAAIGYGCAPCDEKRGVPLARVWLQTHNKDGRRDHRVLWVDNAPPFRRLLQADPFPAPLGGYSLAPYFWRRYEEVRAVLQEAGFTAVAAQTWTLPGDLQGIIDWAEGQLGLLYLPTGTDRILPVNVLTWNVNPALGWRVVGFLT